MPWTKESLQSSYNLTDEETIKTLKVCNLSIEQDEYSDEEIQSKFKLVRSYFDSNRTDTYTGAADLFALETGGEVVETPTPQSESQTKTKKPAKGRKTNSADSEASSEKLFSMFELLEIASKQCKAKITFRELPQIMDSCGLSEREAYTQEECDRFVEACQMLKQQNKSSEEVAAYFGIQQPGETDINEKLAKAASDLDTAAAHLVNELARSKASEAGALVVPAFKYHFAREINSDKIRQEFEAFSDQLHAQLGKGEARMMRAIMEANSTLPLQQKPAALPEASSNGSTHE